MTWEAVTAIATLISAVVVTTTVLLSVRQIRLAADQLQHLRRSTQLAGTMEMITRLSSPEVIAAVRFVSAELTERMCAETFAAEVRNFSGSADAAVHQELVILRAYEQLGSYIKYGLLDGEIFYDYFAPVIMLLWEQLVANGIISMHRAAGGNGLWENFEMIYNRTSTFLATRPTDYVRPQRKNERRPTDVPRENW